MLVVFCDCESQVASLLRLGYWASTPTLPSLGISINLLDELQTLTLECAVSVKGYVQMLRWKNNMSQYEV